MSVASTGPETVSRPRRKDDIFDTIENELPIAAVVCRHFRQRTGAVTYRPNPFLEPDVVMTAKLLLKKPFLASWSKFIPTQALTYEHVFQAFASRIFMTTDASETRNDFWDGKGNYQKEVKLSHIAGFTGHARLAAFSVLIHEPVYLEVMRYLEQPPVG